MKQTLNDNPSQKRSETTDTAANSKEDVLRMLALSEIPLDSILYDLPFPAAPTTGAAPNLSIGRNGNERANMAPDKPSIDTGKAGGNGSPPLDLPAALIHFNDDLPFLVEMLGDLIINLPGCVKEMNAALQAQDIQKLNRLAHNLRGLAGEFCAYQLAEHARDLETGGCQDDFAQATILIARIEAEVPQLREYHQTLLETGGNPPEPDNPTSYKLD